MLRSAAAPELRYRLAQMPKMGIETRPDANAPAHRTAIWVVVLGEDVYVRSFRGTAGRWYQDLKAHSEAAISVEEQRILVRAVPVKDAATITQVSHAYRQKYHHELYLPAMLREEILPTTLRLKQQGGTAAEADQMALAVS